VHMGPSGARAVAEYATSPTYHTTPLEVSEDHTTANVACDKLDDSHDIATHSASICSIRKDGNLVLSVRQHVYVPLLPLLFGALDSRDRATSGLEAHLLVTTLAGAFSRYTDQPLHPVSRAVD
jgi:hypothetical protein